MKGEEGGGGQKLLKRRVGSKGIWSLFAFLLFVHGEQLFKALLMLLLQKLLFCP